MKQNIAEKNIQWTMIQCAEDIKDDIHVNKNYQKAITEFLAEKIGARLLLLRASNPPCQFKDKGVVCSKSAIIY